jgi:hypothetical protein
MSYTRAGSINGLPKDAQFAFVINLKAAKQIGLTIPRSVRSVPGS